MGGPGARGCLSPPPSSLRPSSVRRVLSAGVSLGAVLLPGPLLTAVCPAVSPRVSRRRCPQQPALPHLIFVTLLCYLCYLLSGLGRWPATAGRPVPGRKNPWPPAATNGYACWRPTSTPAGRHLWLGLPGGFWIQLQPSAPSLPGSPHRPSPSHCQWYASPHLGNPQKFCSFWFLYFFLQFPSGSCFSSQFRF